MRVGHFTVGYAPTQKGYKCFEPISKKMFVTMDVTFFELIPYFMSHFRGGTKIKIQFFMIFSKLKIYKMILPQP